MVFAGGEDRDPGWRELKVIAMQSRMYDCGTALNIQMVAGKGAEAPLRVQRERKALTFCAV